MCSTTRRTEVYRSPPEARADAIGLREPVADRTPRDEPDEPLLEALRRRTEFDAFLFRLSKTLIGLPEHEVDLNMAGALAEVGTFLKMDRVTLLEVAPDRTEMRVAYSWSSDGGLDALPRITYSMQPWWMRQVLRGEVSLASRIDDLPDDAAAERQYLRDRGVASAASIPLRVGGEIAGAISFVTARRYETWSPELIDQLRAIADVLWNALRRHRALQALIASQHLVRESEERFRLAMNNVACGVYTLDLEGLVTYVNPAAEAMFGWTSAELLGKKMHDVTHHKHPDGTTFPANECPELQVLENGTELREQADVFLRKDGSFFPVMYSVSLLKKDGVAVGLVIGCRDDTARREAERTVRESEQRFRLLAEALPTLIWMSGPDKRCIYFNQGWLEFTGRPLESQLGDGWVEGVHDDDRERCLETYVDAFDRRAPFHMEYRLRRHDGVHRWVCDYGVPRLADDQSFAGYIGACIDVTDRKLATDALSMLSQRLIEAQEQERARVARELHDDIGQRIALCMLYLQTLESRLRSSLPVEVELRQAIDAATSLTADVQSLSHRLHSSNLKMLGLQAAARDLCRDLSCYSGVTVEFQCDGFRTEVPENVSVCLYRVLQEGLQNAIKHSGSERVEVVLEESEDGFTLIVQDEGRGVPAADGLNRLGLGLISMRERLKLVSGEMTIEARSPRGTVLRARVPRYVANGAG
jgi:PAS domain S-box-containing protein